MAWRATATVALAQGVTVGALATLAAARKRRVPPAGFPRVALPEVHVDGTALQLYDNGDPLYRDMLAAIDAAEDFILFETFIWKDDAAGRRFKERLVAKARQGVAVHVIFDSFANLVVGRAFKRFPPEVRALEYGAWRRPWHALDPRRLARDHRKVLVVDGAVAFLGGFNLGEPYRAGWRDTHLRLRGAAAGWLGQEVIDFWNRAAPSTSRIARVLRRGGAPRLTVRRNDALRLVFPIRGMYLDAVERAEREAWITTAYFIPDPVLCDALVAAARRGVDVRVLVPWASNHAVADWAARGVFASLLAGGVRLFGYRDAMIHAKTMVVDGAWGTVGTANLDRLSQVGNHELAVEVWDRAFAAQLRRVFLNDLTNAFEITAAWWAARPWYARAAELILAPLRPAL